MKAHFLDEIDFENINIVDFKYNKNILILLDFNKGLLFYENANKD
jgi:hypothetical protein